MSFTFGKVFQPFIEERPIAVMARGVLENLLNPEKIDELFERTAEVQYTRELTFSALVDLMGQVVCVPRGSCRGSRSRPHPRTTA